MTDAVATPITSPVALIEAAMMERLRTALAGPAGVTVESYGAQLDDELFAWVRTLPACWVTFDAAAKVEKKGKNLYLYDGTFEVLYAQRHLNENERRLPGASADQSIGVYALLELGKLALAGKKLGLAIDPLKPGSIRSVMKGVANRDAVAVYAQQFHTSWLERLPEDEMSPNGVLHTVGLSYLIKPGDEVADTSDVVTTT